MFAFLTCCESSSSTKKTKIDIIKIVSSYARTNTPSMAHPSLQRLLSDALSAQESNQPEADDWVLLVLSGALNPVHVGHLETLRQAKAQMQARGHRVLGGVLAPSSDSYVRGKLGDFALSLNDRVSLCEAAIGTCSDLAVVPYGNASGSDTANLVSSAATSFVSRAVDEARRTGGHSTVSGRPPRRVVAVPVYGSDFLCRYPHVIGRPFVIMARNDSDRTAEKAQHIVRSTPASAVNPHFTFISDANIPDVSSTRVRELAMQELRLRHTRRSHDSATGDRTEAEVNSSSSAVAAELDALLSPAVALAFVPLFARQQRA